MVKQKLESQIAEMNSFNEMN